MKFITLREKIIFILGARRRQDTKTSDLGRCKDWFIELISNSVAQCGWVLAQFKLFFENFIFIII